MRSGVQTGTIRTRIPGRLDRLAVVAMALVGGGRPRHHVEPRRLEHVAAPLAAEEERAEAGT